MLDINLQVDPKRDQDRRPQKHEPEERHWPSKRHAYFVAAAQQGNIRTEQGKKAERGRAEECQPNTCDLRGSLIPCLADEIR